MHRRVGILGGTFNPIHLGHVSLAKAAYEQLALDKVIFMPSGKSYMKRNLYVLPGNIRYHLIKLSIQGYDYFDVSDIEINRAGNTYTYETLEYMKNMEPETDFYFIVGADSLYHMDKWVNPERIFHSANIVAAVRDHIVTQDLKEKAKFLTDKFQANISLLSFTPIPISSSMIRDCIINQKPISDLVAPNVEDYILSNKLFIIEGENH